MRGAWDELAEVESAPPSPSPSQRDPGRTISVAEAADPAPQAHGISAGGLDQVADQMIRSPEIDAMSRDAGRPAPASQTERMPGLDPSATLQQDMSVSLLTADLQCRAAEAAGVVEAAHAMLFGSDDETEAAAPLPGRSDFVVTDEPLVGYGERRAGEDSTSVDDPGEELELDLGRRSARSDAEVRSAPPAPTGSAVEVAVPAPAFQPNASAPDDDEDDAAEVDWSALLRDSNSALGTRPPTAPYERRRRAALWPRRIAVGTAFLVVTAAAAAGFFLVAGG